MHAFQSVEITAANGASESVKQTTVRNEPTETLIVRTTLQAAATAMATETKIDDGKEKKYKIKTAQEKKIFQNAHDTSTEQDGNSANGTNQLAKCE